ncbi:MAG TPA: hypothetical protein VFL85_02970 [Candidatus Saccharimonadales bacterium]|nr:hypothetical protein [Candidatus Saccharimonadales bacterium]
MNTAEEARVEYLVDTRQLSYSEAMEKAGVSVPVSSTVVPSVVEARQAAHTYYHTEFGLTGTDVLTDEQARSRGAGLALCRSALAATRARKDTQ